MATNVDVLIVGGGLGGVAAAIAAASLGVTVMLVEQTNWLGGQLTSQGVCTPDEDAINGQPVVDLYGATATYRDLKHRIREWYRSNATLSAAGQAQSLLNIGRCWVNMGFAVEPGVAVQVLSQMLAEAGVQPILNATVSGQALAAGSRLIGDVTVTEANGTTSTVTPRFILDATETGDLLPVFGLPSVIGWESAADTGEPDAPADRHPEWVQPVTYPIALMHRPAGEDHTIAKPDNYEAIRDSQQFTLVDGGIKSMFAGPGAPFWTYRRVVDHTLFNDPDYPYDIATINVGSNDYRGGIYPDDSNPGNNTAVLHTARQVSLAYLYWLQTEAPRDDSSGRGWPELMPLTTFFNTADGISPAPYIRESRRILPLTRIVQQSLDAAIAPGMRGSVFADSCGIGNYKMDVHAGANAGPELQKDTKPYQIPLGALIPQACDNLLASGKCLGVTHITNGAYRLHPQEWNVGEAAGALAAFCIHTGKTPAAVQGDRSALAQYQSVLLNRGVPLFWWSDVLGNPFWNHIQMVGVRGAFDGDQTSLVFRPNDPFDDGARQAIEQRVGRTLNWPTLPTTRAVAAQTIASQLGWVQ